MKKLLFIFMLALICICSCCAKKETVDKTLVETSEVIVSSSTHTQVEIHNTVKLPEKEVVVETVVEVFTEQEEVKVETPYYSITSEERELLARILYLEASICSKECKQAVVSVIFNRLESGCWKKDVNKDGQITLYDIIYYPKAFTPAKKIPNTTPDEACYEAVDYVVKNGPTVPTYVRYFRTNHDFKWADYKHYTTMDNTYFGYVIDWENGAW